MGQRCVRNRVLTSGEMCGAQRPTAGRPTWASHLFNPYGQVGYYLLRGAKISDRARGRVGMLSNRTDREYRGLTPCWGSVLRFYMSTMVRFTEVEACHASNEGPGGPTVNGGRREEEWCQWCTGHRVSDVCMALPETA